MHHLEYREAMLGIHHPVHTHQGGYAGYIPPCIYHQGGYAGYVTPYGTPLGTPCVYAGYVTPYGTPWVYHPVYMYPRYHLGYTPKKVGLFPLFLPVSVPFGVFPFCWFPPVSPKD